MSGAGLTPTHACAPLMSGDWADPPDSEAYFAFSRLMQIIFHPHCTAQDFLGHRDPKHTTRCTRVAGHRFEELWE